MVLEFIMLAVNAPRAKARFTQILTTTAPRGLPQQPSQRQTRSVQDIQWAYRVT